MYLKQSDIEKNINKRQMGKHDGRIEIQRYVLATVTTYTVCEFRHHEYTSGDNEFWQKNIERRNKQDKSNVWAKPLYSHYLIKSD